MLSKTAGRLAVTFMLAGSVVLLNGCAGMKKAVAPSEKQAEVPANKAEPSRAEKEAERLALCQKELEALRGVNPEKYNTYKAEFDRLMSGAAQYAGLRTRVNSDTQDTVDALYRYKVNRLCADVGQAALTGLAERGERLK